MRCRQCTSPVPEGAAFCPTCGASLVADPLWPWDDEASTAATEVTVLRAETLAPPQPVTTAADSLGRRGSSNLSLAAIVVGILLALGIVLVWGMSLWGNRVAAMGGGSSRVASTTGAAASAVPSDSAAAPGDSSGAAGSGPSPSGITLPPGAKKCVQVDDPRYGTAWSDGVRASCPFVAAVQSAYLAQPVRGAAVHLSQVFSSTTGQSYDLDCSNTDPVQCQIVGSPTLVFLGH